MIEYRTMTMDDVEAAAELERACFSSPWSARAFAESIRDKNIVYVIAVRDGELVGNCGLRSVAGEGEITNVAVRADVRKQGLATKLLQELMRRGEALGVKAYTLEVRCHNIEAITLYERLGFRSEGIRPGFYTDPVEDAVIMWRRE